MAIIYCAKNFTSSFSSSGTISIPIYHTSQLKLTEVKVNFPGFRQTKLQAKIHTKAS